VRVATEVFLHIGPPKTGTTYLQDVLWANRKTLRGQDLLVPGPSPVSQFHAVVDLLERDTTGLGVPSTAGAWQGLLGTIRAWDGRVVVSHENLGFASSDQVARARADLADVDVHILFTARSLTSVAPAAWQERLKNRSDASWADFLAELGDDSWPNPFWRQHGGGALFDWAEGLPPERVHVVTVPPSGSRPELLWERFAAVLRVDPASCSTDLPRSNESLGIDEAAFLRHYNAGPGRDLSWPAYRVGVKHGLAMVLAQRPDKRRILVGGADAALFRRRAEQLEQRIRSAGFDVVGELAELLDADAGNTPAHDNDDADEQSLSRSATHAVDGLVRELADRQRRHREQLAERQADTAQLRQEVAQLRQELERVRARLEQPLRQLARQRMANRLPWARRARAEAPSRDDGER
jgi:hypothetical protein